MRILHTEWSDGLGGQEKRVLAEAAGLSERGHYVAIACREHARIKTEAVKYGIDVHTFPFMKMYDVQSIAKLIAFLKKREFDVVNTHSGVDSWIGGIAARLAKVPVLVRTRHLNIPLKRSLLNFIHYLPDIYIACGENMRQNLIVNCGFPEQKVVSIPTGVGPEFFDVRKSGNGKSKYGLDNNSKVVTNVSILRKEKGLEITLNAVKAVVETMPDVKFLIVGDGPMKKEFEEMVIDLGISKYVVFAGFVENVPEIYSFADASVLSSWSEGLPQSLLQAMAAGVPVVATSVGGVPEVVIGEKTGMLVEPGDHEAIADGIIQILTNRNLSAQLSKSAKDLILKEHTVSYMVDQIESLYMTLLNKAHG